MPDLPDREPPQIVPDTLNARPLYVHFAGLPPDAMYEGESHAPFFPAGYETSFATLSFFSSAPELMNTTLHIGYDPSVVPAEYSGQATGGRDPSDTWPLLIAYDLEQPIGGVTYSELIFKFVDDAAAQAIGTLLTPVRDSDQAMLSVVNPEVNPADWGSYPCIEELLLWSGEPTSAAAANVRFANMPPAFIQEIALTLVGEAASKLRAEGILPMPPTL